MRLIQSWWDRQNRISLSENETIITELSRLTWENHLNTEITFYSNLKNTNGLNYRKYEYLDMSEYPKQLWSLGKLVAISKQTQPFLHLDHDLFLWNSIPPEKFNKPFIFYHREDILEKDPKISHLMPLPPSLKRWWRYDPYNSNNFALVGGREWKALVDTVCEILEHIKKNKEEITDSIKKAEGDNVIWSAVLVEQIWISEIMRKKKIKATSFLGDKECKLNPFYDPKHPQRANEIGICHCWGHSKIYEFDKIVNAYYKWKEYFGGKQNNTL